MSDSLTVLGLDAADYRLAKRWDCENLLLDNHCGIRTFSYSLDVPATLEVWPTIATGVTPEEHGVVLDRMGWDATPGLALFVRLAQALPEAAHSWLSRLKGCLFGSGVQPLVHPDCL